MRHPIDMAGFGVSAYWPISVMRLMPNIFNGPYRIWGMMTQFVKNANQGKSGVIGFGRSFNGPTFIVIGLSARQFSSIMSLNTDFVTITQMSNQMSKILRPIRDFFW